MNLLYAYFIYFCWAASLDRQNYLRNYRPLTLVDGLACLLGHFQLDYLPAYFKDFMLDRQLTLHCL